MPFFSIFFIIICYGYHYFPAKLKKYFVLIAIVSNLLLYIFVGLEHKKSALKIFDVLGRSENITGVSFYVECH